MLFRDVSSSVSLTFSKDPYRNNKDLACADAIDTIGREASLHEGPVKGEVDVRRVLIFVNEREKTEEVAEYLRSKGIDAEALHRDTPEKTARRSAGHVHVAGAAANRDTHTIHQRTSPLSAQCQSSRCDRSGIEGHRHGSSPTRYLIRCSTYDD